MTAASSFEPAPSAVTLANWRTRPFSPWAFQNVEALVPCHEIAGAADTPPLPAAAEPLALDDAPLGAGGRALAHHCQSQELDEVLVLHRGRAVWRWHAAHRQPDLPHLVFSISKSITGVLAGIMEARGMLDLRRTVGDYLPSARGSGFGDCTLRDLLDMRVSLDFAEEYLDQSGAYARYRRAMLWNPAPEGLEAEPMADMLCSLRKGAGPHGGVFRYLSPNSDMLGLVLEAAAGMPFARCLSEWLWQPLGCSGARITVDGQGAPRTAGGIAATTDDLARLGQALLTGGAGVIPEAWIEDMRDGGNSEAWAASDFADFVPGGRYRSQWYQFPSPARAFMAVGIHGQWLYLDPDRDVVIVVLASQSVPQDDARDRLSLDMLHRLAHALG